MMKQHSKYSLFRSFVALSLGMSFLLPAFASAETSPPALRAEPVDTKTNFCTKIDTVTSKVSEAIVQREAKYHAKRTEGHSKLDERFMTRDAKLVEHRTEWDTKRDEWQAKLMLKASSTIQKTAVEKFVKDMDAAVAARRSAVDSAEKSFRAGVEAAVVARQSSVDTAMLTLKQEVNVAITKAKTECTAESNGTLAPKVIRDAYVSALKSAREKFRASTKTIEARKETLQPLANTRKLAIEKAVADFKLAVEKAKADLKSAMATR